MNYTRGHVDPFWDLGFKNFDYVKQPVTQAELDEWAALGYLESNVKSFTGWMYDSRNPMPDWVSKFDTVLDVKDKTYTFYKMTTCEIMPVHKDHYRTYMRLNNITDYNDVCRTLVFLEDWKPGHYFEVDGKGIINWSAGDYFQWYGDTPHAASNIGVDDRYTLQITGHK